MRIIVFSDTHGKINNCITVLERMGQVDMILHLGDTVRDARQLAGLFPNITVEYIAGNNDRSSRPFYNLVKAENKRIFMTHGHTYPRPELARGVARDAKAAGASIALYGHTHVSDDDVFEGIRVINPGSISQPRDGCFSCAVIEIENGRLNACIYNLY